MSSFPSKEQVERIRQSYPNGTRVELISIEDPYSTLKSGDRATVVGVDDVGDLLCEWDICICRTHQCGGNNQNGGNENGKRMRKQGGLQRASGSEA